MSPNGESLVDEDNFACDRTVGVDVDVDVEVVIDVDPDGVVLPTLIESGSYDADSQNLHLSLLFGSSDVVTPESERSFMLPDFP